MAGVYKRGRSWYLSWCANGRQVRRSLGAITHAEAEAERQAQEQRLGQLAAAGPLFKDWAVTYATWHSQEYPDSYYRVEQILRLYLIPAFGPLPLLGITRDLAERYKARRLPEAAAGTVLKEWRTLQAVLNRAVELELIPRNPIARVRAPRNPIARVRAPRDLTARPPRWYSRDELALIYRVELEIPRFTTPEDADLHRAYRWSWQLLANTGLRRGEGLQLDWRDVGADEIGIRSEPGARTKSGRWRSIPLTRGAREALDAVRPAGSRPRGPVLPAVNPVSLSRAFSRTRGRAELDGHIHCLRHTYCSHLVQAGVPLRTVQVLAGHASSRTTERYAHLAPSLLRDQSAARDL